MGKIAYSWDTAFAPAGPTVSRKPFLRNLNTSLLNWWAILHDGFISQQETNTARMRKLHQRQRE